MPRTTSGIGTLNALSYENEITVYVPVTKLWSGFNMPTDSKTKQK